MIFSTVVDKNGVPYTVNSDTMPILEENIFAAIKIGKEKFKGYVNKIYLVLGNEYAELYDPLNTSENHNKKQPGHGKKKYELKKCNYRCYVFYITYLRSKNHTHFIIARREFQNG